jgi:hypothetical protein
LLVLKDDPQPVVHHGSLAVDQRPTFF